MRRFAPILLLSLVAPALTHANYGALTEEYREFTPKSYLAGDAPSDTRESAELKAPAAEKSKNSEEARGSGEGKSYRYFDGRKGTSRATGEFTDDSAASEALNGIFDLATLEGLVSQRNRSIEGARKNLLAAMEKFDQAGRLDEVLRTYSSFTEGLMTGVGPMMKKDSIDRKYPSPGSTALKGTVIEMEVEAARANYDIAIRDALTDARKSYWELVYLGEAIRVRDDTLTLLERLERVATALYEAGKTSFQDVIKVRIKRKTLEQAIESLKDKKEVVRVSLRHLTNLTTDTNIGSPAGEFEKVISREIPPKEILYQKAIENRQELKRMGADIARMEAMIEMGESMNSGTYQLGYSRFRDEAYMQVGSTAMQPPFTDKTTSSMGAGSPKQPWYGTSDSYLAEMRKKLEGARETLAYMETAAIAAVEKKYASYEKAKREHRLYDETIVSLQKGELDVAFKGYEAGKTTFPDIIGSFNGWLSASLSHTESICDIAIKAAELEKTVGRRFELPAEER